LIVSPGSAKPVMAKLSAHKLKSWVIGEAVKGNKSVEVV
jgi:hypothetical protein